MKMVVTDVALRRDALTTFVALKLYNAQITAVWDNFKLL